MAFFLCSKGLLHPYQFKYLKGSFEKARLQRTEIHSPHFKKIKTTLPVNQKEFFAIDIMTRKLFTLELDSLLGNVQEQMKNHNIRHIPIVSGEKLLGMISDRDLLKVEKTGTFLFLKAVDVMTSLVIAVEEETPLGHIARVLIEEKISAIPVINHFHKLSGIITRTDILETVVYNRLVLK